MQWIVAYGEETEIPISANTVKEAQKAADELTDFREWIPSGWRSEGNGFWVNRRFRRQGFCIPLADLTPYGAVSALHVSDHQHAPPNCTTGKHECQESVNSQSSKKSKRVESTGASSKTTKRIRLMRISAGRCG